MRWTRWAFPHDSQHVSLLHSAGYMCSILPMYTESLLYTWIVGVMREMKWGSSIESKTFRILHFILFPSLSRNTGSTCPAPIVPSYLPSMQSQPAKTCSGWCSPQSSPPCPTLTPVPTHTAITWPMGQGCWGTTHWLGLGSSAPSGTPEADARGMNRWGSSWWRKIRFSH